MFEIFSCQIALLLCLIMEWKYPSSFIPLSVPQYIFLIPSFNSCKTSFPIHPPPILKENLNMRRKEEPEKTDNIYAVCLRKSRIYSQLKGQKWVWKKALCVSEDNIYTHCSVKARLTVLSPPEWSCHQRLVFFWPATRAFTSLATGRALTLSLPWKLFPLLSKGVRNPERQDCLPG